jgi:hypothetical protein
MSWEGLRDGLIAVEDWIENTCIRYGYERLTSEGGSRRVLYHKGRYE